MPVDRDLFSQPIRHGDAPPWICPTCAAGHLRLMDKSLRSENTASTEQATKEEGFDFDWVVLRFVAVLQCDNKQCMETAVVAGKGELEQDPDVEKQIMNYAEVLRPTYVFPSPSLIKVPDKCPSEVVEQLERAFVASWSDFSAAGNHIRSAVERLLDSLKIKKQQTDKKGKRFPLSLHARITEVRIRYPQVHDGLLAIKWLGNAGSHDDALTRDSVFDAFDIFESVIDDLYSIHPKKIAKLVREVNRRKGPAVKRK